MIEPEIIQKNHEKYLARKALFNRFGYDVDTERAFILNHAQPISGKILEAGTGSGHFALALAKAGYSFVTFDISEETLNQAKLNLTYAGFDKQVDFRIENGEHTRFDNNRFDVIFSINVLHHLANPYQVIDEMIRILAQNGKFILADFNANGFKIMDDVHEFEGETHEKGQASLQDISLYLKSKNYHIHSIQSKTQEMLIIQKGIQ